MGDCIVKELRQAERRLEEAESRDSLALRRYQKALREEDGEEQSKWQFHWRQTRGQVWAARVVLKDVEERAIQEATA